ncbi:DUF3221 domain-containing protein [Clostridium sp.]|uniref:DUF3221 domain-containing protein n=1 Tax=Clostridium sp. TaxID=1506 RepID=UPI002FC832BA
MLKRLLLIMCTFVSLALITGCDSDITAEKIGIRGQITKIALDDSGNIRSILVEGKVESDTQHDKASIGISENTKIYKDDIKKPLAINDLKEGLKVEVIFEGPVRESYPVQADAKYIRVIE